MNPIVYYVNNIMRTIEELDTIQREAYESFGQRHIPDLIKSARRTGSITGGVRHHSDIVKATLIAGGLLAAVIAGVAVIHSNMGGDQGLQDRVSQLVHMVNR